MNQHTMEEWSSLGMSDINSQDESNSTQFEEVAVSSPILRSSKNPPTDNTENRNTLVTNELELVKEQPESKIACNYCKKNHRKCSRTLPSCSNCLKRGIMCFYNESKPKTISRKIKDNQQQHQHLHNRAKPQQTEIVTPRNPSVNRISSALAIKVEDSLSFYNYLFYEIIPKSTFYELVENIDESSFEFKATVFALQAWREQRLGSLELAEIYYQHARLMIAPYFFSFTNINVAMALFCLSSYALGQRNYKEISLYLDILKYFEMEIAECESKNYIITPEMRNLIKHTQNFRSGFKLISSLEKGGPETILSFFPSLVQNYFGIDVCTLGFDINNLNKDECFAIYDSITFHAKNNIFPNATGISKEIINLFLDLMDLGHKIATLVYLNYSYAEIWNLASRITQMCKSEYFSYAPLIVIPFVDMAIAEHTRIAPNLNEVIDRGEKKSTLVLDFEVLTSLNRKHGRVDQYFTAFQSMLQNTVLKEILDSTETFAGTQATLIGDGLPAKFGYFSEINGFALDPVTGDWFIGDSTRIFSSNGTISTYAGKYTQDGSLDNVPAFGNPIFSSILDIAFHPITNDLYVCDYDGGRVLKIDRTTTIATTVAGSASTVNASLALGISIVPTSLAFSPEGDLFIGDENTNAIMKITSDGLITTVAGTGGDPGNNLDALATELSSPLYVRFNNGSMYIGEELCIRRREADNTLRTIVGVCGSGGNSVGDASTAKLYISGFTFIPDSNDILIVEGPNRDIKLFNATTNQVSRIAGTGDPGNNGDGGSPLSAAILPQSPGGIIVATKDNKIYFGSDKRFRMIANNTITTVSGMITWTGHGLGIEYSQFTLPKNVVLNKNGDCFVTDGNGYIYKFSNGQTRLLNYDFDEVIKPREGPIEKVYMGSIYSLSMDTDENIFYSEADGRLKKIINETSVVTVAKGSNLQTSDGEISSSAIIRGANMPLIHPITQELYYFENPTYIRKVSNDGKIVTVVGSGIYEENGFANTTYLDQISHFTFSASGDLMVVINSDPAYLYNVSFVTGRITKGPLTPYAMSVFSTPNYVYVLKKAGSGIIRYDGVSTVNVAHNYVKMGVFFVGNDTDIYLLANDGGNAIIKRLNSASNYPTFGTTTGAYTDPESITEIGVNPLQVRFIIGYISTLAIHPITSELCLSVRTLNLGYIFCIRNDDGLLYRYAGGGSSTDEGVLANQTWFYKINGFSFDSSGNLYYAELNYKDTSNYGRIRKINYPTKIVTTIVGGFGDGNLATNAQISDIQGAVASQDGNIYISTQISLRKISKDGIISTLTGLGKSLQDNIPIKDATYTQMSGIRLDKHGNIYLAVAYDHVVRFINMTSGTVKTIAGTMGSAGYMGDGDLATNAKLNVPKDIFLNSKNELYITDSQNNVIRKVLANGTITTFAGIAGSPGWVDGNALSSQFNEPLGIAVRETDLGDEVYVVDSANIVLRRIFPTTICNDGYYGTYCTEFNCFGISSKSNNSCSGNGVCNSSDLCICRDGYFGSECNQISCFGLSNDNATVCSSFGSCVAPNNCSCSLGHYGEKCEMFNCYGISNFNSSFVCSQHGSCVGPNNCSCNSGYNGTECQDFDCYGISHSSSSVCSQHGLCVSASNCSCYPGYIGNNCDDFECHGISRYSANVCSKHGSCIGPNNCSCITGYYGVQCQDFDCFNIKKGLVNACSGNGQCVGPNNCSCNSGFNGTECQDFECYGIHTDLPNVCNGNGSCISPNNCSCDVGYYGVDCKEFDCFNNSKSLSSVCGGNGSCVSPNKCSCNSGYFGAECKGFEFKCFGISNQNESVCSKHGQCIFSDLCNCSTGYYGSDCSDFNCFGIHFTNSSQCSKHGSCVGPNNCSCISGYYGSQCQEFDCFGIHKDLSGVCNGNGSCTGSNNCSCNSGYNGNSCQNYDCQGISHDSLNVCSQHGSCISPNNCSCNSGYYGTECQEIKTTNISCNPGYYGSNCEDFDCYGILLNSSSVCSKHGSCVSPNNCSCNTGYFGTQCQDFECYNIQKDLSSACNGNGSCVSPNNCSCNSGYYGSTCKDFQCNGIHFSNSQSCSQHGSCISPNTCLCNSGYYNNDCSSFKCFGIPSSDSSVCSQHGSCTSPNTCSCERGYSGDQCQYPTITAKFLNNYSGITFNLDYSSKYEILNCSKLIFYKDWSLFGNDPICTWSSKENNIVQVILGEDSRLLPNMTIILNRLATKDGVLYENVTVLPADKPVKPVIVINSLNETSPCESIVIDASKSYSGDRRPVVFNWKLIENPSGLPIMEFHESIISINSSIAKEYGYYKFKLQIQSSISGELSDWIEWSVYKSKVSLPVISIIGLSPISTTSTNVPFKVKKTIDLPECYYEDTSHTIDWQLISGPLVSFYKDVYNNLVITNFTKGNQEYQFKVTAISNVNTLSRSSSFVKIITIASPLTLKTFSSDLTSSSIKINSEYIDEEQTNEVEVWNWSCSVLNSNNSCGNSINSALTQFSSNKQSIITLDSKDYDSLTGERPKLRISLTINKGTRSASSFTDFQFSNLPILPPTVNLIQYYPTSKDVKSTDTFSLDLQVTANGQTIDIDKYIIRQWKLNNILLQLSDSVLNKMSIDPSKSNSIVLDASKLIQGSTNVISLNVTDIRNYQSALYSQEFRIIQPPLPCVCSVSPSSGYALETTFSFSCSNCQNEYNTIQLIYGFVDDKSGTYIPLYVLGETYSTKLPTTAYPLSNNVLATFIKIVDTSTGASTEILQKVSILVPTAKSVTEVKKKVAAWSAYEKTLLNGDSTKMIFNSAVISRTSEAMVKNLSAKKRGIICQNGGIYDETTQRCVCPSEYTKTDCSMSVIKQTQVNEMRSGLLDAYLKSFEIRSQNEVMNENVLSMNSFGLDSLLSSFDELDNTVIEKSFKVLSTLLDSSLNNKKLSPVKGVETLLAYSLNSIFSYMYFNDFEGMDNYFTQLEQTSFGVGKMLLQSRRVGEKPVILTTLFNNIQATKLYRTGFSQLSINFGFDSINFPSDMPLFLSEKSDRKAITLISKSANSASIISSLLGSKQQVYNQIIGNNQTIISTQRRMKSLRSIGFDLPSVQFENVAQPISFVMQLDSEIDIDFNKEKLVSQEETSTSKTSNYSTISYSCMEQTDASLLETTSCTLNIRNSTFVTCDCVKTGFFIVIEHKMERSEILSIIPPQTETSNPIISHNQPDVVAIVVPIVIIAAVICLVVVIVFAVIGIILAKRKKPVPTKEERNASLEMSNFSV